MARIDPKNTEYRWPDRGPKDYGTGQVYNKAYELEINAGDYVLMNVPESTYEIRLWAYPDPGTVYTVEQSPQSDDTEEGDLVFIAWDQAGIDTKDIFPLVPGNWFKLSVSSGIFKGHAIFWRG